MISSDFGCQANVEPVVNAETRRKSTASTATSKSISEEIGVQVSMDGGVWTGESSDKIKVTDDNDKSGGEIWMGGKSSDMINLTDENEKSSEIWMGGKSSEIWMGAKSSDVINLIDENDKSADIINLTDENDSTCSNDSIGGDTVISTGSEIPEMRENPVDDIKELVEDLTVMTSKLMKETSISVDEEGTFGSDHTLCNDMLDTFAEEHRSSSINEPGTIAKKNDVNDSHEKPRAQLNPRNSVASLLQEISDGNGEVIQLIFPLFKCGYF